jgi:UDP:flavonoid glycosyltransferase YjiC (YdhE family)
MGHVLRSLEIAKELRKQGNKVIFACEFSPMQIIEKEGFTRIKVKEYDKRRFRKVLSRLKFYRKNIEEMIGFDLIVYNKVKPDIVISDFRLSSQISAEIAKILNITLLNVYSTRYSGQKESLPPHLRRMLGGNMNSLLTLIKRFLFWKRNKIFNKIRKRHGLRRKKDYLEQLEGDFTFICDLPELFRIKKLPKSHFCIGPLYYKEEKQLKNIKLDKKKKTVYISLGSEKDNLIYKIIENIDLNRYNVIVTGFKINKKGIFQLGFFPGLSIIKKSDIVICHGGNGTIYQALSLGKPIIAIPLNLDQNLNADAIESEKVGRKMKYWNVNRINAVIESVLKDKRIKENLSYFSKLMKQYKPEKFVAEFVKNNKI